MPSKTVPYNHANIFSHTIIVATIFYAYIRKNDSSEDGKSDYLQVVMCALQFSVTLMLIYVSTGKLKDEVAVAKKKSDQEDAMLVQAEQTQMLEPGGTHSQQNFTGDEDRWLNIFEIIIPILLHAICPTTPALVTTLCM